MIMYFAKQSKWRRAPLMLVVFALVSWQVPHRWAGRQADSWFESDAQKIAALSRSIEEWVSRDITRESFRTGSKLFDGEWLFGTYQMAGVGFCQEARLFPERREHLFPLIERCIERVLSEDVKAFDVASWNADPIESLDDPRSHHAAYLGYLNLLLSVYRELNPESPYNELNDRISDSLARRLAASDIQLIQTYPYEAYPVDNCAVVAGIGLHEKLTPSGHAQLVDNWKSEFRARYIDEATGLLKQAVSFQSGEAIDEPRGTGTMLGLYFLSFWDRELSGELFAAAQRELPGHFLGFGGMREYPRGNNGVGDIDSGPVIFGFGMSSTGFSLAGCRIHGDRKLFKDLFATLQMCGAPLQRGETIEFVSGGPLGNAIAFAMLTAVPADRGQP
jgi:hypothetical protein